MRKDGRKIRIIWLFILLFSGLLVTSNGCQSEPSYTLLIENQTDQSLTIYVDSRGNPTGIVEPGKSITTDIDGNSGRYLIRALNHQGEVLFSETFTFITDDKYHLQQVEGGLYKAVIPPLQNN